MLRAPRDGDVVAGLGREEGGKGGRGAADSADDSGGRVTLADRLERRRGEDPKDAGMRGLGANKKDKRRSEGVWCGVKYAQDEEEPETSDGGSGAGLTGKQKTRIEGLGAGSVEGTAGVAVCSRRENTDRKSVVDGNARGSGV